MIFITVGTSLPHDSLILKMDQLAENGTITDDVVAQIGAGKYRPRKIESFRFLPSLEEYFQKADVIISNCGAGTIMENVTRGRRLIAIQNPDITGGHEWELVKKMERGKHLIWCKSLEELPDCISRARSIDFVRFEPLSLDFREVLQETMQ